MAPFYCHVTASIRNILVWFSYRETATKASWAQFHLDADSEWFEDAVRSSLVLRPLLQYILIS